MLDTLIEEARALDAKRLELDRESKKLKERVEALSATAIGLMQKQGISEYDGARLIPEQKPYISEFPALEKYIVEHGAIDLLEKRLSKTAVRLRWDDGIVIPGVGVSEEVKLKLR